MVKDDMLYGVIVAVLGMAVAAPLAFHAGTRIERLRPGGQAAGLNGAPSSAMAVSAAASHGSDLQNEYYRGFYDACVVFNQRVGIAGGEAQTACGEAVIKIHGNHWYDQPSEGYLPPVEAEAN